MTQLRPSGAILDDDSETVEILSHDSKSVLATPGRISMPNTRPAVRPTAPPTKVLARVIRWTGRSGRRTMKIMQPVYLALGDSMSIDAYAGGPGRGAASLLHRNRDGDYPDWAGQDLLSLGYTMQNLARDGATTVDVLNSQLPQINARPDLVTLSMGGNDLMGAYGNTAAARQLTVAVGERAERILDTLRAIAGPAAAIMVTTVYDPSDGTGALPGGALPPWPDGPDLLAELNTALIQAARRHVALVSDVHAHFHGHGAAAGDPAQPDPRPADTNLWYCGVIEPNGYGAHEIRRVWWRTLHEQNQLQRSAAIE